MQTAYVQSFRTAYGSLTLVATEAGIAHVDFDAGGKQRAREVAGRYQHAPGMPFAAQEQIREYLAGKRRAFDVPLDIQGSLVQKKVWASLQTIPYGSVALYHELAWRVGSPKGFRAVGQALARNPLPILIPCHRVLAADGLGGYAGGPEWKRVLLEREGVDLSRLESPHEDS